MGVSKLTAESAFLSGKAAADKWRNKFMEQWQGHEAEIMLKMLAKQMMELPDQVKDQLKKSNPEQWAQIESMAGGRDHGQKK